MSEEDIKQSEAMINNVLVQFAKRSSRSFYAPYSSLAIPISIPIKSVSHHNVCLQPVTKFYIPPSKSDLYASFFCSLIHIFLSCGHPSRASEALVFMQRNDIVPPDLHSWNRLLHVFSCFGLASEV